MKNILNFDVMITPLIIKILFWVGVAASVITGLVTIVGGFTAYYGGGGIILSGLLIIIIGPIVARIYCELLIIAFKMFDSMKAIQHTLEKQSHEEEY